MKKIELKKGGGPVVFLGGINALPMMYAIELKGMGYDVIYFVDRPAEDLLSRPENHFSSIEYPYPDWVVEFPLLSQMFLPFARRHYAKKIIDVIRSKRSMEVQVYIFNSFFMSLAPYFPDSAARVALAAGSDIDVWADVDGSRDLAASFSRLSFYKFLPLSVSARLIPEVVERQYKGVKICDKVVYFPKGFNARGDRVIDRLLRSGVDVLGRYDVSFDPLLNAVREYKTGGDRLVIFSPVRFSFKTFTEANDGYNKGNDLIIGGLSDYYRENKNIEVHFVEKGLDVSEAKRMCEESGLAEVVVWHPEMKFKELLSIYEIADICFDQVGKHWISAVGAYALWLGKPLIANDSPAVRAGVWPEDNPVYSAWSAETVREQLRVLASSDVRRRASQRSKHFAEEYLGPERLMSELFEFC